MFYGSLVSVKNSIGEEETSLERGGWLRVCVRLLVAIKNHVITFLFLELHDLRLHGKAFSKAVALGEQIEASFIMSTTSQTYCLFFGGTLVTNSTIATTSTPERWQVWF